MIHYDVAFLNREIFEEILPLAEKHYNEVVLPVVGKPFDLSFSYYEDAELHNFMVCTAYDDDKLVGYLVIVEHQDHKAGGQVFGAEEGFYVAEDYRSKGIGEGLVDNIESFCKDAGLDYLLMCFPKESKLMTKKGYSLSEYVYVKRFN